MNLEALKGRITVAAEIATRRGLAHVLCDPDHNERALLGITADDTAENHKKREKEWLRRTEASDQRGRVLFICGAAHVDGFAELCRGGGWIVTVEEKNYEAEGISLENSII